MYMKHIIILKQIYKENCSVIDFMQHVHSQAEQLHKVSKLACEILASQIAYKLEFDCIECNLLQVSAACIKSCILI